MASTSHVPGFGRSVFVTAAPMLVCAAPFVFGAMPAWMLPVWTALLSLLISQRLSEERRNDKIALAMFNDSVAAVSPIGTYAMQKEAFALLIPSIQILTRGISWVPALPEKWRVLQRVAMLSALVIPLAGGLAALRTLPMDGDWKLWLPQLLLLAPLCTVLACRPDLPKPVLADEREFADLICAWLLRSGDPVNGGKAWLMHLVSQGLDVSGELIKMKIEELLAKSGKPPDGKA